MTQTTYTSIKTAYRSYSVFWIPQFTAVQMPHQQVYCLVTKSILILGYFHHFHNYRKSKLRHPKWSVRCITSKIPWLLKHKLLCAQFTRLILPLVNKISQFSLWIHMCWLDTPHSRPHAYTRCAGTVSTCVYSQFWLYVVRYNYEET